MTGNRDQKATRDADYFTEETINYGIDVTFSKDKAKLHYLLIWTVKSLTFFVIYPYYSVLLL